MNDSQVSLNDARKAMLHIDTVTGDGTTAIFVRQIAPQLAVITDFLNQQVAASVLNDENAEAQAVIAKAAGEHCACCAVQANQLVNANAEVARLTDMLRIAHPVRQHLG